MSLAKFERPSSSLISAGPAAALSVSPTSNITSPAKSEGGGSSDEISDDREIPLNGSASGSNAIGAPKRTPKGRVFQCTGYTDCNMSFTRSEHLARHKRKHTGERPFTCPHCSKNFSRLDNLRQHKQTVHAYEIFNVHEQKEQQLHQHLQQHHHHQQQQQQHHHLHHYPQPQHLPPQHSQYPQHMGHPQLLHLPPQQQQQQQQAAAQQQQQQKIHHSMIQIPTTRLVLPEKSSNPETPNTAVFSSSNVPSSCSSVGSNHNHGSSTMIASGSPNYYSSYISSSAAGPTASSSSSISASSSSNSLNLNTSGAILKPLSDMRGSRIKRRPRPLSLSHSFYGGGGGSSQPSSATSGTLLLSSASSSYIQPPLKSAPLIPPTNKTILYGPKSASLTPNMVSPLSPLFHHSFNQTINIQSPYHAASFSNGSKPGSGNSSSTTLPPVQLSSSHFSSPPSMQFAPIPTPSSSSSNNNKRKGSLSSILDASSVVGSTGSSAPGSGFGSGLSTAHSSITPPLINPVASNGSTTSTIDHDANSTGTLSKVSDEKTNSRQWLRGVLNEEPNAAQKLSPPVKLESKKPTINSLLSPY